MSKQIKAKVTQVSFDIRHFDDINIDELLDTVYSCLENKYHCLILGYDYKNVNNFYDKEVVTEYCNNCEHEALIGMNSISTCNNCGSCYFHVQCVMNALQTVLMKVVCLPLKHPTYELEDENGKEWADNHIMRFFG